MTEPTPRTFSSRFFQHLLGPERAPHHGRIGGIGRVGWSIAGRPHRHAPDRPARRIEALHAGSPISSRGCGLRVSRLLAHIVGGAPASIVESNWMMTTEVPA
ncbi:MAG: hypothetical protein U1F21_11630 [Sphaerotilus natans]